MFEVIVKSRVRKDADSLPASERRRFGILLESLRSRGPVQGSFPNYSKLGGNRHHCHLSPRWVACWEETEKGIKIEVYYVGNRGNAPY
ncbi:MAG: hypothetical protein LBH25_02805 [Fibromonadaceae bacterium]|nr:hypothetical protein [Fibromonadaceae bacterium]